MNLPHRNQSFSSRRPRRGGLAAAGLVAAALGTAGASSSASASMNADVGLGAELDPQTIVGGDYNSGDPSVPLLIVYGQNGEQSICTGSVVGAQWILTAAHCVDVASLGFEPVQIDVYFGTEYSQQDPGYIGQTYADDYLYHERWDTNNMEGGHDIAVVHLAEAVDLPLMPLLARPLQPEDLGTPARLIGWGLTLGDRQDSGAKRHVMSSIFDFDDLLVQIGDTSTNVCSGDSGGPAVMNIDGQDVQFGVTSFGDVGCVEIGIDTRVDTFADWIAQATSGEVVPAVTGVGSPSGQPPAPGPGGDGGPTGPTGCQTHDDCGGGLCVSDGDQSLCTTPCTSGAECGAGMDCFATDDPNEGVCWPSDEPGTVDPDDPQGEDPDKGIGGGGAGGRHDDEDMDALGCSVSADRRAGSGLLALFGLALAGFIRRRR